MNNIAWGKLCDVCGGSGSVFVQIQPFTCKPCPGKSHKGLTCVKGILCNQHQNPYSLYYAEFGDWFRPIWEERGVMTREQYNLCRDFHLKAAEKRAEKKEVDRPTEPVVREYKEISEEEKMVLARKQAIRKVLFKFIIDPIEWPFIQVRNQWNCWFHPNTGKIRKWIEPIIGTTVTHKTNQVTYSSTRIVKNKWVERVRGFWHRTFQYGKHHINNDKWWTFQIQIPEKSMVELTWRQNVGWCVKQYQPTKRKDTWKITPLIWWIREDRTAFWPAPVFEVM